MLLVACTLAVYWQVHRFDFVNIDDRLYITQNSHTQEGLNADNIKWAFTTYHASNWHPVTWLSFMLNVQLFGDNPGTLHMINVLYHLANTLLLFFLLHTLTGRFNPSVFTAFLFALHPLHVESVAWIAEHKDVLSTFFWLLTMLLYVRYTRSRSVRTYGVMVLTFTIGMMAKPMLVTLPVVLLLIDIWPLDRTGITPSQTVEPAGLKRCFLEKVPMLIIAGGMTFLAFSAQASGQAMMSHRVLPLIYRMGNALLSYIRYIVDMFVPSGLAVFYPHPETSMSWISVILAAAVLLGITVFVCRAVYRMPYLAVGWGWYLITLLPVIGIIQIGGQSHADRYTYVPLTGLFILLAWGVPEITSRWNLPRQVLPVLGSGIVLVMMVISSRQVGYWENSITLMSRAVNVTEGNYLAHNNLAGALEKIGRLDMAVQHYQKTLQIDPNFPGTLYNLGRIYEQKGNFSRAEEYYLQSAERDPGNAPILFNLGNVLVAQKKYDRAVLRYRQAVKADPGLWQALSNCGHALRDSGRYQEAIDTYHESIRINPSDLSTRVSLGRVLAAQGMTKQAAEQFKKALELEPRNGDVLFDLGYVLWESGHEEEGLTYIREAVELRPDQALYRSVLQKITISRSE